MDVAAEPVTRSAGKLRGLTHARTSFIGRSDAVAKVVGLLDSYRLVTVTGPGGVGKTRLADEVLKRVVGRFADGVAIVELAAVAEPALVAATVATALEVHQAAGMSIVDALVDRLSRQQLLLVLDSCEHVLDAAAELCAALLVSADDIKILATSREPLGLPEESRYRLPPLTLPDPNVPGAVVQAEAVALFVERARQLDPDFTVDGDSGSVLARLVQRLDGMPLAIELAAARVEALGLPQLLDRLDDRFRLLVSANRAATARQRSLEATVDWSYQLLSGSEQRVFRRLAVFPGPFTLDAAEAVAGAEAGSDSAAPGRLLAAGAARDRARRAIPVLDAGDAARLRPEPAAGGGRGAGRGGRAGRARAGRGRTCRGSDGDPQRRAARHTVAGRRGRRGSSGPGLGAGSRPADRTAAGRGAGALVAGARPVDPGTGPAAARRRADRPGRGHLVHRPRVAWPARALTFDYDVALRPLRHGRGSAGSRTAVG